MSSINDIIKKSFLDGFNTDIDTVKIVVTLIVSVILGFYIYFVYRYKNKSSLYSKDFNNVLAVLPLVVGAIVLAMQSSIVISLGMVGALSIVRFRNAVKSSLDLLFLFWSISVGIICGAGLYEIGIILSLFVTILLLVLDKIPFRKESMLLVVNSKGVDVFDEVMSVLDKNSSFYRVKSRGVRNNEYDYVIELRCGDESKLIKKCNSIKGIYNISLLTYEGVERL